MLLLLMLHRGGVVANANVDCDEPTTNDLLLLLPRSEEEKDLIDGLVLARPLLLCTTLCRSSAARSSCELQFMVECCDSFSS